MFSIGLQYPDSGGRSGETAQRRSGKDGLQENTGGVLQIWENRVLTENSHKGYYLRIHETDHFQPGNREGLQREHLFHVSAGR